MAAFRGRQAQYAAFHFDIVGYFPHARSDSFLTRAADATKESDNQMLGVLLFFDTNIYFGRLTRYVGVMLRRATRINSVSKASFGAGLVVRADLVI
jgi:hypothetical protein